MLTEVYMQEEEMTNGSEAMTLRECLTILGLAANQNHTMDQIRKAYRKMALKLHPDKHTEQRDVFEAKFKVLSVAYRNLTKREQNV